MEYDFQETSADGAYTASLTNSRLDMPGRPPTSTLVITSADGEPLGTWTLGGTEFWAADPDANVIVPGTFDVDARSYTHDVWTGNYSPGTPLTEHALRTFTF